jgi:catalase
MSVKYYLAEFTNTETDEKVFGIEVRTRSYYGKDGKFYSSKDKKEVREKIKELNAKQEEQVKQEIQEKLIKELEGLDAKLNG